MGGIATLNSYGPGLKVFASEEPEDGRGLARGGEAATLAGIRGVGHGCVLLGLDVNDVPTGCPTEPRSGGGVMMPQPCVDRDTMGREFRELMEVAGMIARHPDYPGKRDVVEGCVEDIVERSHRGRLTRPSGMN